MTSYYVKRRPGVCLMDHLMDEVRLPKYGNINRAFKKIICNFPFLTGHLSSKKTLRSDFFQLQMTNYKLKITNNFLKAIELFVPLFHLFPSLPVLWIFTNSLV
jgi:hypothetical protein